jgi:hypothetical protein
LASELPHEYGDSLFVRAAKVVSPVLEYRHVAIDRLA